jgi:hypothetical protein
MRASWRFFVTGQAVSGKDTDNATFLHAATVDHRGRPVEKLRGPLWKVLAWRWAVLGIPALLCASWGAGNVVRSFMIPAPGWATYPWREALTVWEGTVILSWLYIVTVRSWWWLRDHSARVETAKPTARAVCQVLNIRYRERDARGMVVLPRGYDRPGKGTTEPVRINIPVGRVVDDRTRRNLISAVSATLGLADAHAEWVLSGSMPHVLVTERVRPPDKIAFAEVAGLISAAERDRPLVGMGPGRAPVHVDFVNDSPHALISGGSGTGKSVLLKMMLCQRMHHGTGLLILDYKRVSHRWALDLPGCLNVYKIPDIHNAAVAVGVELQRRIDTVIEVEEAGGEFQILDVLMEEANSLYPQMAAYWKQIREPDDPVESPAVAALKRAVYMGREMGVHVLIAGQRVSASVFGGSGGDTRESFQIRMLSKWTRPTWKMLADSLPFQRFPGGGPGVWGVVRDGGLDICRVPLLSDGEARSWAMSGLPCPDISLSGLSGQLMPGQSTCPVSGQGSPDSPSLDTVTLAQALPLLPGPPLSLDALRKASQRSGFPEPVGAVSRNARVYELAHLVRWKEARDGLELGTSDSFGAPVRAGLVYAFDVRHPSTGEVVLGYVGQTRRRLEVREGEHLESQPWADTIVGRPYVLWEGYPTDAELDAIELGRITALQPLYNYEGQEGASHAVPKWVARDQRWARDDAAGRRKWMPPS